MDTVKNATKLKSSKKSLPAVTTGTEKTSKRRSKEAIGRSKVIRLLGNRSVFHVPAEEFAKVSQLIKQQLTSGNLMATVDLHRFSDPSITALVNFVQTREIKMALTYYAITELVTLSHTFQMKDLKTCLEDSIIEAAKSSEADLLQTIIICDVGHVNPETEKSLQTLAIEQIEKLVTLPDFNKMPSHQLFQILSSCDLSASHEMFVADVVLLWLGGQTTTHVNAFAPALLSCIRTKFLSPVDRTLIIERLNQLNMPNKLVRLARNMLESTNSHRVCLDPAHLKKNSLRCGVNTTNPSHFNPHSSLPLSRPNFNIKIKKSKETNGKTRPTFDPATAPKVIDLINTDPKAIKTETNKTKSKKEQSASKTSEKSKNAKRDKKGKSRKCACIEYVKSKMSRKNKKTGPLLKDSAATKINRLSRPTDSSKSSITSKMASSSKSNVNASRSSKLLEKRRAEKRGKIQNAIKSSKSMSETNLSSKSTKNSLKSEKSQQSAKTGKVN